ncbi:hypothetical protein C8R44DRAFT_432012 [Mycena epipterygia]|nr:hypothetical protein C8R44DRAFT_432012 [Mycena epipterygia]
MAIALFPGLCAFLILAGEVKGQETGFYSMPSVSLISGPTASSVTKPVDTSQSYTSGSNPRILRSVVIAAVILSLCFLIELVVIVFLVSRDRRRKKQRSCDNGMLEQPPTSEPPDADTSSRRHSAARSSLPDKLPSAVPSNSAARSMNQLPATPTSWISDGIESNVDVTIPPSPLLHTQFPGTPLAVPGTPTPSSNLLPERQTWVTGSEPDRLTIVSLPSQQYPQSTRSRDSRVVTMSEVQGIPGRDDEKIALEQLIARLRARIRELETYYELLSDASSFRGSLPSYKSR